MFKANILSALPLILYGCSKAVIPDPVIITKVETVDVGVAIPVNCNIIIPPREEYPDNDLSDLSAEDPGAIQRGTNRLLASRLMRHRRIEILEAAIAGCRAE